MRVNYIKEITSFTKFIRDEEPSGYAQLLWYALMAIFNERGHGDEWPEEIQISNRKLLADFPFSEDTLTRARQELIDLGRIRFRAGSRGERPCYGLCPFAVEKPELSTGRGDSPQVSPQDNPQDNPQDSPQDNPQDSPQDNPLTAGQPAEQIQTGNAYAYVKPSSSSAAPRFTVVGGEEDDEDIGEVMRAWREAVGPERLPVGVARALIRDAKDRGMPGAAPDAVREAARFGAQSPVPYAHALLADWAERGITLHEAGGDLTHRLRAVPPSPRSREGRMSGADYLRRKYGPEDFAAMEVDLDAEAGGWNS